MNQFSCEVAVIGGGLSGCAAASNLARAGVDVALFEAGELPRHRVCGEFLSPESRATLGRMEVLETVLSSGARRVESARFCCEGSRADFDLGSASGLAISRYALDPILFDSTTVEGARAFLGCKTRELVADERGGFRFETGGETWRAKAVILAAGRAASPKNSSPKSSIPQKMKAPEKVRSDARFCGLKAHFSGVDLEVGVVEMHLFRGGYCGLVRVEGEVTNACLMIDYARLGKLSPAALWEKLLAQNRELRARFAGATRVSPWCSTGNVSFETFRPIGGANKIAGETANQIGPKSSEAALRGGEVARGILCAGDAAGYIHPLTGDGMAMALRAGELAATCARLSLRGLEASEAARLYEAAWRREFASRLRLASRLHPLALRPQWARPVLPLLQHLPMIRRALVRGTRGIQIE